MSVPKLDFTNYLQQLPCQKTDLEHELTQTIATLNSSKTNIIHIYSGDSSGNPIFFNEVRLFKEMVQNLGITWQIQEVTDDEFNPNSWDSKKSILMIPAAKASDLDTHLGKHVAAISDFVTKRGGKYLGQCGGGYWACNTVSYRLNETEEFKKVRSLNFWKGIQKGPYLTTRNENETKSEFFHGTPTIKWKGIQEPQPALLSGGGSFIPAIDEHKYEVLATYQEAPEKLANAVVKTYPGKGIAVLANPYFTYSADHISNNIKAYKKNFPQHNWKLIVADLKKTELFRKICFAKILKALIK